MHNASFLGNWTKIFFLRNIRPIASPEEVARGHHSTLN